MASLPALPLSFDDIENETQLAKEKMEAGIKLLIEARNHLATASMSDPYLDYGRMVNKCVVHRSNDTDMREFNRYVDSKVWSRIVDSTPLWSLLDHEERSAFFDSVDKDPAPVTVQNIESTLRQHFANAETYFYRGVAKTFITLCNKFKSHEPFKLGKKIILQGLYTDYTFRDKLNNRVRDMDRAFHLLDGKKFDNIDQSQGLSGFMQSLPSLAIMVGSGTKDSYEDEYFSAKFFKNGNVHVTFKRADLVKQCNKIIAKYFGDVVADARSR